MELMKLKNSKNQIKLNLWFLLKTTKAKSAKLSISFLIFKKINILSVVKKIKVLLYFRFI